MAGPFTLAMYGGFLVVETYDVPGGNRTKVYTVPNVRLATVYDTFEAADAAAKWAANHLYPPDLRYYAILQPPEWPAVAQTTAAGAPCSHEKHVHP
jgi:hypothetical protein